MPHVADLVKEARRVSTPLIAVDTQDQEQMITQISARNGTSPKLRWDVIQGVKPLNDSGTAASLYMIINEIAEPGEAVGETLQRVLASRDALKAAQDLLRTLTMSLVETLERALQLPDGSALFVLNAHRHIEEREVAQALANLRSPYKLTSRTLLLLSPGITLPSQLAQDVQTFHESLPTDEELSAILDELHTAAGLELPGDDVRSRAIDALRGLSNFAAEQVTAMSLRKSGIDLDTLWLRKRAAIEQVKGIKFSMGGVTLDEVGGLAAMKELAGGLFSGPCAPRVIVFVDELEKAMAGAATDSSGVSQDFHKTILTAMEDNKWSGIIAVGPPGAGKSHFARSMGNSYKVPTIEIDLGAAKGSLVGQSEQSIRDIIRAIEAMAGPRGAYFVATCNKLDVLSPELLRRFRDGIYMFDLPTPEERENIWSICLEQFAIDGSQQRPVDTNWTGADIRTCCDLAWRLNMSLLKAAQRFVPVAKSDPQSIQRLRSQAEGRFLSASHEGAYSAPETAEAAPIVTETGRRLTLPE